jgi:hypothetical protein
MATDEFTKLSTKIMYRACLGILDNPATNPTRTSWLSTVTSEPLHSHAHNLDVITPLTTQKWKKFCLATGSKQQ